ncbi:helix-turn-helix transcriptional regulator [Saccharomonospora sp. NB11]|jgi:DNA-binding CsgD family transcriptional regulator|uniref:helix-turn-helix transcriptional regulator n=1 Tax=Saccharomonospora sp. NB11 TaxID=1642298 RepID=UPI0018D0F0B0|nr:helix-turn-helix transcriptional regulator [Saccharomonospora sp. NB11]
MPDLTLLDAPPGQALPGRAPSLPTHMSVVHAVPGSVRGRVDAALVHAARDVGVSVTSVGGPRLFRPNSLHHRNLRRGVRYRVLLPERDLTSVEGRRLAHAWAAEGAEVRTTSDVPLCALLIDDTATVLPGTDTTAPTGTTLFTLPSVVAATRTLFARMWESATPLHRPGADTEALTPREREILVLLASGRTDESVACLLGVSVRTVRRLVAGLMDRLDARSRFEAGVKAARRGWLGS